MTCCSQPSHDTARHGAGVRARRRFVTAGPRVDIDALLAELAKRGANEVLIEAGATLTGEVFRLGLWDEAIVYLAPKLLGRDARPLAELSVGPIERRDPGDDHRCAIDRRRPEVADFARGAVALRLATTHWR